jgi:class 3 adenylate cyclase
MNNPSINSGQRLPTGTVTFLFTDIEGSTKLSQQYRDEMPALLAHPNVLRAQLDDITSENAYNTGGSLTVEQAIALGTES